MDVLIPIRGGFICSSISADFVWEVNVAPVEQVSERTAHIPFEWVTKKDKSTPRKQVSKKKKSKKKHGVAYFTDYFRESR